MIQKATIEIASDSLVTSQQLADETTHQSESIGQWILGHIQDSNEWHLPFGINIHLPQFEPVQFLGMTFDFSITNHVLMTWIAAVIILLMFRSVKKGAAVQKGLGMFLEMIVVFVRDEIALKNVGDKYGKRFTPFLVVIFLFILVSNFMGLIPIFTTSTSNISITAALAVIVFAANQIYGIREIGIIKYYVGLVPHGVPIFLWPLMFIVELVGLIAKHVVLMIRLFANMTAGHIVLFALIGLVVVFKSYFVSVVSIPFGLFVYSLEILVATIQAYIFTLLAALFIGMSVNPDH